MHPLRPPRRRARPPPTCPRRNWPWTCEGTHSMTTRTYRGNPEALNALVRPDQVHRDLYINQELFELEQEHFFANTWNYVGHDSQIPKPGDYITNDIGGRPLIVVRHTDNSIQVLMNRCAHKGSQLVTQPAGNTGKFFRCPYHAWTFKTDGALLAVPMKLGYEGTRFP